MMISTGEYKKTSYNRWPSMCARSPGILHFSCKNEKSSATLNAGAQAGRAAQPGLSAVGAVEQMLRLLYRLLIDQLLIVVAALQLHHALVPRRLSPALSDMWPMMRAASGSGLLADVAHDRVRLEPTKPAHQAW